MLALVATLLLSKAAFGRHLYALGTSATVAEFSGVPTARTTILTYVISGLTAAFAGMLLTGYSGQAYLGMGDAYLFTSIAAVAIGGASILGGSGHYLGTVAGAMVLTILTGLLPALNLSSGALLIVYGAVILLTVSIGSETLPTSLALSGQAYAHRKKGRTMVEITCVVDARPNSARARCGTPRRRCSGGSTSGEADPSLRSRDRQGRDLRDAGISRLPRPAREGRPGADHGERLPFLRSGDRRVRGDRRPGSGYADTRFNDGKPDRQGRFWSGTMFEAPGKPIEFIGALYRLDPDLSVHRMIEGIGCSNGLAWSPDSRTMYFSDSHAGAVWAYDFDPATGDIENRRTFIDMT